MKLSPSEREHSLVALQFAGPYYLIHGGTTISSSSL